MNVKRLILIVSLLFGIHNLSAQGSKNYVSVKFADSTLMNFALQAVICDSFTCLMQSEKLLFYEKSYRSQLIELTTGELLETIHLPPRKHLIETDKVTTYYNLNDKLLSQQSPRAKLFQMPLLLLSKFKFEEFLFGQETKLVSGVLCNKGTSLGPDGDTTIIWVAKDSDTSNLKSIFNLYFINPPTQPILEFSIKNFQLGTAVAKELTYGIYSFEVGDFSKEFLTLNSYKPATQAEIDQEMKKISETQWEEYRKKKKN